MSRDARPSEYLFLCYKVQLVTLLVLLVINKIILHAQGLIARYLLTVKSLTIKGKKKDAKDSNLVKVQHILL